MIESEIEEEAILHILGELNGQRQADFLVRLENDPELKIFVAETIDALGGLALELDPVTPPDALRDRVLSQAGATSQTGSVSKFRRYTSLLVTGLCSVALIAGWLFIRNRGLQDNVQTLNERVVKLEQDLEAANKGFSLANLRITALRSELNAAYEVLIAWDQMEQTGILKTTNLPPISKDQEYQFWIVDKGVANPISAGTFHLTADAPFPDLAIMPAKPIKNPIAFALSLEKKGGAATPQGPIIVQNGL